MYQRLMREFVNVGFRMSCPDERETYSAAKLCDDVLSYAEPDYWHHVSTSTDTAENVRLAMRHLFEFAADLDATCAARER